MAKNKTHQTETENEAPETAAAPETQGGQMAITSRKIITMKMFVPDQDWINREVVGKGKGTQVTVGRVYGVVMRTREKITKAPDGLSDLRSVALDGMFEAVNNLTGEISEAGTFYPTETFGQKLMDTFNLDDGVKAIRIDIDVALEATGKTIPYAWVIRNYCDTEDKANPLVEMRKSRGGTARLTAPPEQAKLSAPE